MAPVANSLARRPVLGRGGASWRRTTKLTAISWYGSRSVSSYRQTANATSALPGTGPVTSRPVGETRRWAAAVGTRYCTPLAGLAHLDGEAHRSPEHGPRAGVRGVICGRWSGGPIDGRGGSGGHGSAVQHMRGYRCPWPTGS